MEMIPLHIRAYLRTQVVSDVALPLDGILLYQAMRRAYGPRRRTLSGAMPNEQLAMRGIYLPLACCDTGTEHWYYKCSFAQWPEETVEGKSHWVKRINTKRLGIVDFGRKRKIVTAKGRYRLYHMPVFYYAAPHIDWYVVGNLEQVRDLLSDVWAIGKKQAQGWGRVRRWVVEPWSEDWSVWRDGKPMRAVPADDGMYIGFRPPYWLRENQTVCIVPWMSGKV